jgi:hypothetical protein
MQSWPKVFSPVIQSKTLNCESSAKRLEKNERSVGIVQNYRITARLQFHSCGEQGEVTAAQRHKQKKPIHWR